MNYHNVTGTWPQIFSVSFSLATNSQTITVLFSVLSQPEECTTNTLICYALCSFARSLADQHLKSWSRHAANSFQYSQPANLGKNHIAVTVLSVSPVSCFSGHIAPVLASPIQILL